MKRILIISPDNRHFVREYIENALVSHGYDVTFFTILRNKNDFDFYEAHNVKCIGIKRDSGGKLGNNILHVISSWIWLRNNRDNFDVIHVHFMNARFLKFCRGLLKSNSKLVITFWGSDLLRDAAGNKDVVQSFYPWVNKASAINLMEQKSLETFKTLFNKTDFSKACIIDFGDSLLNLIEKENERIGRDKAKELFALPLNKTVIHIGYNGNAAQQHLKILHNLIGLSPQIKEKIYLVMHLGYGNGGQGYSKEEYIDAVKREADATDIEYKLLTEYLSGNDLADFRLTADVMLYGQITDAISSTIVETVFAGGLFINPTWLDYSEFNDAGIKFVEYNKFEEIPEIVTNIVKNGTLTETEKVRNKEAIVRNKSWDVLGDSWRKMYD